MQQKPLLFIICMAAAFVAGAVSHAVFQKADAPEKPAPGARPASQVAASPTALPAPAPQQPKTLRESRPAIPQAGPPGSVVLREDVLDAILTREGELKLFQRLGLTKEDREEVSRIHKERTAAFKQLEASHAKVIAGPDGNVVEILPFPDEREQWFRSMEEELGKRLGEDRAAVVARMIAYYENEPDTGTLRREISVVPPKKPGGKMMIQEKKFSEQGKFMDNDYNLIDDDTKSRWGHVLDFENTN